MVKPERPDSSEGEVMAKEQGVMTSDQRLLDLGYRPEFRREMSLFGVLGISFCAIGILTGMSSAFQTGLFSGGPLSLFWGWNVSLMLHSARQPHKLLSRKDMQFVYVPHRVKSCRDLQCIVSMLSVAHESLRLCCRIVQRWEDSISGFAK